MSLFDIFLNIIKQFGLVSIEKQRLLSTEVEEFEQTATPNNEKNKAKQMYGKLHFGEYGLLLRIAVFPIIYFYLRKELKDVEKDETELLG